MKGRDAGDLLRQCASPRFAVTPPPAGRSPHGPIRTAFCRTDRDSNVARPRLVLVAAGWDASRQARDSLGALDLSDTHGCFHCRPCALDLRQSPRAPPSGRRAVLVASSAPRSRGDRVNSRAREGRPRAGRYCPLLSVSAGFIWRGCRANVRSRADPPIAVAARHRRGRGRDARGALRARTAPRPEARAHDAARVRAAVQRVRACESRVAPARASRAAPRHARHSRTHTPSRATRGSRCAARRRRRTRHAIKALPPHTSTGFASRAGCAAPRDHLRLAKRTILAAIPAPSTCATDAPILRVPVAAGTDHPHVAPPASSPTVPNMKNERVEPIIVPWGFHLRTPREALGPHRRRQHHQPPRRAAATTRAAPHRGQRGDTSITSSRRLSPYPRAA